MIKAVDFIKQEADGGMRLAVLTGEEDYLREQSAKRLLDALPDDVEVQVFDGAEVRLSELLDELRMAGLFGGERLVRLGNADGFVKEHEKALVRFFEEGEAVQRLVIEGRALMGKGRKTLPKRGFVAAAAKLGAVIVQCDTLFDAPFQGRGPAWQSPLSRWVVDRAAARGKRLTLEDAYLLHRMVGNKLRELDGEVKKLATFVKDAPQISAGDIERCVGEGRLAPVFDLADAVAGRCGSDALEQSRLLFERGMTETSSGRHVHDHQSIALRVLFWVGARMRKVARAKELMATGESFDDAAKAVGENVFFRDRLRAQVEAWRDDAALRRVFHTLVAVERELKSGGGAPRVLMDRFLVVAVGVPRRAAAGGRSWRR